MSSKSDTSSTIDSTTCNEAKEQATNLGANSTNVLNSSNRNTEEYSHDTKSSTGENLCVSNCATPSAGINVTISPPDAEVETEDRTEAKVEVQSEAKAEAKTESTSDTKALVTSDKKVQDTRVAIAEAKSNESISETKSQPPLSKDHALERSRTDRSSAGSIGATSEAISRTYAGVASNYQINSYQSNSQNIAYDVFVLIPRKLRPTSLYVTCGVPGTDFEHYPLSEIGDYESGIYHCKVLIPDRAYRFEYKFYHYKNESGIVGAWNNLTGKKKEIWEGESMKNRSWYKNDGQTVVCLDLQDVGQWYCSNMPPLQQFARLCQLWLEDFDNKRDELQVRVAVQTAFLKSAFKTADSLNNEGLTYKSLTDLVDSLDSEDPAVVYYALNVLGRFKPALRSDLLKNVPLDTLINMISVLKCEGGDLFWRCDKEIRDTFLSSLTRFVMTQLQNRSWQWLEILGTISAASAKISEKMVEVISNKSPVNPYGDTTGVFDMNTYKAVHQVLTDNGHYNLFKIAADMAHNSWKCYLDIVDFILTECPTTRLGSQVSTMLQNQFEQKLPCASLQMALENWLILIQHPKLLTAKRAELIQKFSTLINSAAVRAIHKENIDSIFSVLRSHLFMNVQLNDPLFTILDTVAKSYPDQQDFLRRAVDVGGFLSQKESGVVLLRLSLDNDQPSPAGVCRVLMSLPENCNENVGVVEFLKRVEAKFTNLQSCISFVEGCLKFDNKLVESYNRQVPMPLICKLAASAAESLLVTHQYKPIDVIKKGFKVLDDAKSQMLEAVLARNKLFRPACEGLQDFGRSPLLCYLYTLVNGESTIKSEPFTSMCRVATEIKGMTTDRSLTGEHIIALTSLEQRVADMLVGPAAAHEISQVESTFTQRCDSIQTALDSYADIDKLNATQLIHKLDDVRQSFKESTYDAIVTQSCFGELKQWIDISGRVYRYLDSIICKNILKMHLTAKLTPTGDAPMVITPENYIQCLDEYLNSFKTEAIALLSSDKIRELTLAKITAMLRGIGEDNVANECCVLADKLGVRADAKRDGKLMQTLMLVASLDSKCSNFRAVLSLSVICHVTQESNSLTRLNEFLDLVDKAGKLEDIEKSLKIAENTLPNFSDNCWAFIKAFSKAAGLFELFYTFAEKNQDLRILVDSASEHSDQFIGPDRVSDVIEIFTALRGVKFIERIMDEQTEGKVFDFDKFLRLAKDCFTRSNDMEKSFVSLAVKISDCSKISHSLRRLYDGIANRVEVTRSTVAKAVQSGTYNIKLTSAGCCVTMVIDDNGNNIMYEYMQIKDLRSRSLLLMTANEAPGDNEAAKTYFVSIDTLKQFILSVDITDRVLEQARMLVDVGGPIDLIVGENETSINVCDAEQLQNLSESCSQLTKIWDDCIGELAHGDYDTFWLFHPTLLLQLETFLLCAPGARSNLNHDVLNSMLSALSIFGMPEPDISVCSRFVINYEKTPMFGSVSNERLSRNLKNRMQTLACILHDIRESLQSSEHKLLSMPTVRGVVHVVHNTVAEMIQFCMQAHAIHSDGNNLCMPTPAYVLACDAETSWPTVKGFLIRALLCRHSNEVTTFMLLRADALPYSVTEQLVRFINDNVQDPHNVSLIISTVRGRIATQWKGVFNTKSEAELLPTQIVPVKQYIQALTEACSIPVVQIVSSTAFCGGKTEYITEQLLQLNMPAVRLCIESTFSKDCLVAAVRTHSSSRVCHMDIVAVKDADLLDMALFQFFILGSTYSESQRLLVTYPRARVYVEVPAQTVSLPSILAVFESYKVPELREYFRCTDDLASPVQYVCSWLKHHRDNLVETEDCPKAVVLSRDECFALVDRYFLSQVRYASMSSIKTFVSVLYTQLGCFSDSPFCMISSIRDSGSPPSARVRTHLLEFLISMAKQFACLGSVAMEAQCKALQNKMADPSVLVRWQETQPVLMMFNKAEPSVFSFLFTNVKDVPRAIVEFASLQMLDLNKVDRDMKEQVPLRALLRRLVSSGQVQDELVEELSRKYALTQDNVVKIFLIWSRICGGCPVVLQGETGCGKTSVIRYLASLAGCEFDVFLIHAGISEADIRRRVRASEEKAQNSDRDVWLFLDEMNTCESLGLLKDIICSHSIDGVPLHSRLKVMAACNPYRKRVTQNVVVGLQKAQTSSVNDPLKGLVYRVHPLPLSMYEYLWDFGSLNPEDEKLYIRTMVKQQLGARITAKCAGFFADLLVACQDFCRKFLPEMSISLRDVNRSIMLTTWFFDNNTRRDRIFSGYWRDNSGDRLNREPVPEVWVKSMLLAVSIAYYVRFFSRELRDKFQAAVVRMSLETYTSFSPYDLERITLAGLINEEGKMYLEHMTVPRGTARNTPLVENVFVMVVCILNRIPLFVVGKPGCSKSLALQIVISNMRGKDSDSPFFRNKKSIYYLSYQGSESSTSEGIERVFQKAIDYQRANKDKDVIAVVVLDEVGLAEISKNNPLKVLHSILEPDIGTPPEVGVIGISNWELDPAKMNRATHLSRPELDEEDLKDTATEIVNEILQHRSMSGEQKRFLQAVCTAYCDYFKSQRFNNFHGLRDFYFFCKSVGNMFYSMKKEHWYSLGANAVNEKMVLNSLQRNFGGDNRSFQMLLDKFCRHASINDRELPCSVRDLVSQNLTDLDARHLMLVSREDSALVVADAVLKSMQNAHMNPLYLIGSPFPEDKCDAYRHRVLSQIVLCMETGQFLVLKDMDGIYSSLYDMLNLNYVPVGNKKHCRVAIGQYSNPTCEVKDGFRCIVLIESEILLTLDPPFLNRFEKQYASLNDVCDTSETEVVRLLREWVGTVFRQGPFDEEMSLCGYNNELTIPSLVVATSAKFKTDGIHDTNAWLNYCKRCIVDIATAEAVLRIPLSLSERSELVDHYFNTERRQNLRCLLDSARSSNTTSTRAIVHTFCSVYTDASQFFEPGSVREVSMNTLKSEQNLTDDIVSFKKSDKLYFLLHMDAIEDKGAVVFCKFLLDNMANDMDSSKTIAIILHWPSLLNQSKRNGVQTMSYSCWNQFVLNDFGTRISGTTLIAASNSVCILECVHNDIKTLVSKYLGDAFSTCRLKHPRGSEICTRLISSVSAIETLAQLVEAALEACPWTNREDWIVSIAKDLQSLVLYSSLYSAADAQIKCAIVNPLSDIIEYLEVHGLFGAMFSQDEVVHELFMKYLNGAYSITQKLIATYRSIDEPFKVLEPRYVYRTNVLDDCEYEFPFIVDVFSHLQQSATAVNAAITEDSLSPQQRSVPLYSMLKECRSQISDEHILNFLRLDDAPACLWRDFVTYVKFLIGDIDTTLLEVLLSSSLMNKQKSLLENYVNLMISIKALKVRLSLLQVFDFEVTDSLPQDVDFDVWLVSGAFERVLNYCEDSSHAWDECNRKLTTYDSMMESLELQIDDLEAKQNMIRLIKRLGGRLSESARGKWLKPLVAACKVMNTRNAVRVLSDALAWCSVNNNASDQEAITSAMVRFVWKLKPSPAVVCECLVNLTNNHHEGYAHPILADILEDWHTECVTNRQGMFEDAPNMVEAASKALSTASISLTCVASDVLINNCRTLNLQNMDEVGRFRLMVNALTQFRLAAVDDKASRLLLAASLSLIYALVDTINYQALFESISDQTTSEMMQVLNETYRSMKATQNKDSHKLADDLQLLLLRTASTKMELGNLKKAFEFLAKTYEIFSIPSAVQVSNIFSATDFLGCNVFATSKALRTAAASLAEYMMNTKSPADVTDASIKGVTANWDLPSTLSVISSVLGLPNDNGQMKYIVLEITKQQVLASRKNKPDVAAFIGHLADNHNALDVDPAIQSIFVGVAQKLCQKHARSSVFSLLYHAPSSTDKLFLPAMSDNATAMAIREILKTPDKEHGNRPPATVSRYRCACGGIYLVYDCGRQVTSAAGNGRCSDCKTLIGGAKDYGSIQAGAVRIDDPPITLATVNTVLRDTEVCGFVKESVASLDSTTSFRTSRVPYRVMHLLVYTTLGASMYYNSGSTAQFLRARLGDDFVKVINDHIINDMSILMHVLRLQSPNQCALLIHSLLDTVLAIAESHDTNRLVTQEGREAVETGIAQVVVRACDNMQNTVGRFVDRCNDMTDGEKLDHPIMKQIFETNTPDDPAAALLRVRGITSIDMFRNSWDSTSNKQRYPLLDAIFKYETEICCSRYTWDIVSLCNELHSLYSGRITRAVARDTAFAQVVLEHPELKQCVNRFLEAWNQLQMQVQNFNCRNRDNGFTVPRLTNKSSMQFALYDTRGPGMYLLAMLNVCTVNHNELMDKLVNTPLASVPIQSLKREHTLYAAVVVGEATADFETSHDDDYVPRPSKFDYDCGSFLTSFWSSYGSYGDGASVMYRFNEIEDTISLEYFKSVKKITFDTSSELPAEVQYTDEIFVRNLKIMDSLCKAYPQISLTQPQQDAIAHAIRQSGLALNNVLFEIRRAILVLMSLRPSSSDVHSEWQNKLLSTTLRSFKQQHLHGSVPLFDLDHVADLKLHHIMGLLECAEDCVGESVLGSIRDNKEYNQPLPDECQTELRNFVTQAVKTTTKSEAEVIDLLLVGLRRIAIRMLSLSSDELDTFKPVHPIQTLLVSPEFYLLPKDSPADFAEEFPVSVNFGMFSATHRFLLEWGDEILKKRKEVLVGSVDDQKQNTVQQSPARLFTVAGSTTGTFQFPMIRPPETSNITKKKQK